MKLKLIAFCAVALVLVGKCGSEGDTTSPPEVSSKPAMSDTSEPVTKPAEPEPKPDPEPKATEPPATEKPDEGTALAALALLAVKGRAPMTGYDRDRYGPAWLDADRNGCDTRNDVLSSYLTEAVRESNGCVVATGVYEDPYTGSTIEYRQGDGTLIDIDHVVAMGNSWATGAFRWGIKKRAAFANDPLNLLPADASANRQKGDGDAATWLPANKAFRCAYVSQQVAVKQKYGLWVTAPEQAAIERVLTDCPGQALPADTWNAPTVVDHNIVDPGAAPPTTSTPPPSATPVPLVGAYFENCDAARAAGAAPVRRGGPGYGRHLDGDGDGAGCE